MPIRKRTILQEIKYFSLFNLGVTHAQNKAEKNHLRLINVIGIVFLISLFLLTLYSIYRDYVRIVLINTIAILGISAALYLNYREYYSFAKSVLITVCTLTILVYFLWQ